MALTYTNIQHEFRKTNKLSCNEYVLCDMVFILSSKEITTVPGWCYMTKDNIASELDLTKQGILKMIDRLIDDGFLIRNETTRYLKTTQKWQEVYWTSGKQSLPDQDVFGKLSSPHDGKQSLPNNNTLDNNKNDKDKANPVEILKKKKDKLYSDIMAYKKTIPGKYPNELYKKFFVYWSEEHKNGKKIRFDDQEFFNIGKRLATFKNNTSVDELNQMWAMQKDEDQQPDLFSKA